MSAAHTPTPWALVEEGPKLYVLTKGEIIVTSQFVAEPMDAEHIVRCLNAHDELVELLTKAHDSLDEKNADDRKLSKRICKLLNGLKVSAMSALCKKCGSDIIDDRCEDETCPYSDWPQSRDEASLYETKESKT